jgi:Concanavalin A-like lectin/glucanases superfamily
MALTGWGLGKRLERLSQVIDTYPFLISAWVNQTAAGSDRCIVHIGTGTTTNARRAELRLQPVAGDKVQAIMYDTTTYTESTASTNSPSGSWFHACGQYVSTSSRNALLNGASKGSNTTTTSPAASDRIYISQMAVDNSLMGATDGIAEISLWDCAGMTAGNMDTLAGKLYNGGAAGAGGNPLNITAEAAQPWTGKLMAYWPLTSTTDLADASGNSKTLTMQGTLTNFASHPTIESVVTGDPVGSIRPRTTVSIVP